MAKRNRFKFLENPIDLNRRIMDGILKKGDVVIDATCGNGHDSDYIAEKIGGSGTLYCFDIQLEAIKKTQALLSLKIDSPKCLYFQESHENFELFINTKVDCIFYNLGYLPNSDKTIITNPEITIKSLQSAFNILKPNGIISLISYLTHDQHAEYDKIKNFLITLDQNKFSVAETSFILRKTSPILMIIEKL